MCSREICPCQARCPLQSAMESIGGKWKIHILCAVYVADSIRYNQLKRKVPGISNTMLANCLRELEEDGLVQREEFLEVPVRVEYRVTPSSRSLIPILRQLAGWQLARKDSAPAAPAKTP